MLVKILKIMDDSLDDFAKFPFNTHHENSHISESKMNLWSRLISEVEPNSISVCSSSLPILQLITEFPLGYLCCRMDPKLLKHIQFVGGLLLDMKKLELNYLSSSILKKDGYFSSYFDVRM